MGSASSRARLRARPAASPLSSSSRAIASSRSACTIENGADRRRAIEHARQRGGRCLRITLSKPQHRQGDDHRPAVALVFVHLGQSVRHLRGRPASRGPAGCGSAAWPGALRVERRPPLGRPEGDERFLVPAGRQLEYAAKVMEREAGHRLDLGAKYRLAAREPPLALLGPPLARLAPPSVVYARPTTGSSPQPWRSANSTVWRARCTTSSYDREHARSALYARPVNSRYGRSIRRARATPCRGAVPRRPSKAHERGDAQVEQCQCTQLVAELELLRFRGLGGCEQPFRFRDGGREIAALAGKRGRSTPRKTSKRARRSGRYRGRPGCCQLETSLGLVQRTAGRARQRPPALSAQGRRRRRSRGRPREARARWHSGRRGRGRPSGRRASGGPCPRSAACAWRIASTTYP